jgi:NAD(P)H-hydrate repair Nnr-like enzyme with NAD(P)H-hydrate dehydratase domain
MIASLLAQGMGAFEAAWAGAWLHGQAGLAAGTRMKGTTSILASDVVSALPQIFADLNHKNLPH